jgi:hypothetical protein
MHEFRQHQEEKHGNKRKVYSVKLCLFLKLYLEELDGKDVI